MTPTHYAIRVPDARTHQFEVTCTIDDPDPDGQRLRLPTWVPGSYLIREFARHFVSVRAECRGREVAIAKEAKDCWRAAPCDGPLTVVALVYAFDLSVRTAYVDTTRAYFNGSSVFLCPDGHADSPCSVLIERPHGDACHDWRVATSLRSAGAAPYAFGEYEAHDYAELIDHPVEMSAFALATFEAGGADHDIAIAGPHRGDLVRLGADLARVCQWQVDLFNGAAGGRAPFPRYVFLAAVVGEGYGGLEHRSSTSLLCAREGLPVAGMDEPTDAYVSLLGLASHEYFHSWNIKRIKPAAFVPYDLRRENYTRLLWAFEGFTSYYDDLALVRSGVIAPDRYLQLVGRTITALLRTPGRSMQSVADSSFDAWIKFYRQDENTPNAVVSYYAKGALIGLALDLLLRQRGSSLDVLMRMLWREYGSGELGVPEDGVKRIAVLLGGAQLEGFFADCVEGTRDPPLRELLHAFGVEFHLRASSGAKDRGGQAAAANGLPRSAFGAKIDADAKLIHAYTGGAAELAGLAAGDVLIALDGLKATADSLASVLRTREPGTRVPVHAFRRDELFETTLTLQPPPMDTCYLTCTEAPDARIRELRSAWLGS